MSNAIVAEPLNPHGGFNWVFLVELLICTILTIFFLFYSNRLFATLVSYGIRAYTWHTLNAYIDITSLQISLLGGRVFFKDIRYHGHNETILVHSGYITWNYWLRRVRDAGVYTDADPPAAPDTESDTDADSSRTPSTADPRSRNPDRAEKGGKQTQKQLPCRISVKISGVEIFQYNRSPGYDAIVEAVQRKAGGEKDSNASTTGYEKASPHEEPHHEKLRKAPPENGGNITRANTAGSVASHPKKDDLPAFLKILPVYVEVNKGALVLGNENTLAVMTVQFEKATGTLDASTAGPMDVYQQLFKFRITHPVVHMKPNPDYKTTQLDSAAHFKDETDKGIPEEHIVDKEVRPRKRKRWLKAIPRWPSFLSSSSDSVHTHTRAGAAHNSKIFASQWQFPGQDRWKGLARYLDDSQDNGHGEWDGVEYAKTSLIVDCPSVCIAFYWDVAGPVLNDVDNSRHIDPQHTDDINGSAPPRYGMDVEVYGGVINYGPWTDRHRGVFQSIFFPGSHVDAIPALPLKPGELRVLTVFKLFLSIENETILRIPIREPSKDWKWKGKAHTLAAHENSSNDKTKAKPKARRRRGKQRDTNAAQNVRPFAWIDVKVASNSSISYVMDMAVSKKGFRSKLDVDIARTEIFSSVNHGLLWRSGSLALNCDLSAPIEWNTLRKWMFNIKCRDLELFLLRDHLFLLTDLIADWGSGPPPDYFLFVPFQYLVNIDFTDFKLYINTNDSNIINNPADVDDNNFIVLHGKRLHGDVAIPLDKFRPLQNAINFDVQGHDLGLEFIVPEKNTLKTFVQSPNVAQLGGLTLVGSYTLMSETSTMNTDRLYLDVKGHRLNLRLYGWLIHQFLKVKDNYFGDDMHFKTLEEFQGLPSVSLAADGTDPNAQPAKISNDLDVILCISVDQTSILLPANLYSAEHSIRADLPFASADLRFTNYYMDLVVNFSPMSVSLGGTIASPEYSNEFSSGRTELFIDSVIISGHRLFGLPPTEPTYVCNWDFEVGKVSGECTPEFIETAAGAGRAFAFTLDNDENALPLTEVPVIHDATFLRLRTQSIQVWLHVAQEALLFSIGSITLDFNDLAGDTFSQRLNAYIPNLTVGTVDARSASRHPIRFGGRQTVETYAFMQTTLSINMLQRKLDFTDERDKQRAHMQEHDQRTLRTQFLCKDSKLDNQGRNGSDNLRTPAMQYPEIPHPIFLFQPQTSQTHSSTASRSSYSDASSARGRRLRNSDSRSTSNSSLAGSIRSAFKRKAIRKTAESSRSRTLLGNPHSRPHSSNYINMTSKEDGRTSHNLPPSSVALSSSLASPCFPLDQVDPDLTNVPLFPALPSSLDNERDDNFIFNDVSAGRLDESFTHTSLLVSAEPGIRFYCTPEFIRCASSLVELIQPRRPEDMIDDFQVKVMTKILDNRNRLEGKGSSLEFNIRIPFTHVRFQHGLATHATSQGVKDQYDVVLNRLKLAARIKKFPGERAGENLLSLHTTLGSLGVSVSECTHQGPNEDVAVQAEIKDVLIWTLQSKATSVNVTFRSLEIATASKKIEYLASLIHRTTVLADELVTRIVEVDRNQQHRLQYAVWYLTGVQDQYPDPAFLTKASYALRAARDHLRSHDSWKLCSRIRYTWQCLPENEKTELTSYCSQRFVECPADVEQKIIAMWDQWRAWDLAHVDKSLAMKMLFGHAPETLPTPQSAPLHLNIKSAGLKLIVDPGPRQSEVELRLLAIKVDSLPPAQPTGLMLVENDVLKKSTVVQVSSKECCLRVQWEICELAEALAELFRKEQLESNTTAVQHPPQPPPQNSSSYDQDLHVVVVTDKAQIMLETINLQYTMAGQCMRISLVHADNKASGLGETLTAHVHAELAVSELSSRSRTLAKAQFQQPNMYFAQIEHEQGSIVPKEIKVAAKSHKITVKVEEDALGLIEVVDSVVRDEAAYFYRQAAVFRGLTDKKIKEAPPQDEVTQLPNVTLALFMDSYQIELALLQPLGWSITGSSGRIAVIPALGKNVTLQIDYDLEACLHRMYSSSVDGINVISTFELPPVNGRLSVTQNEQETRISASGMIETIKLQASELQALITTIGKPEMSNMCQAVQDDVEVLKIHIEEIFPSKSKSAVIVEPSASRHVLFGVQMTMSGVHIIASAPGQQPDSPKANLVFRLSSVQLKATNIDPEQKIMLFPEAVVRIHEINIEITLVGADSVRRCGNLAFSAVFQATTEKDSSPTRRVYGVRSSGLQVNIFADTASAVVDVMNHLQDKIKDLDLSKEKKYLRRLRNTKSRMSNNRDRSIKSHTNTDADSISSGALFTSTYSLELLDMQISWIVGTSIAPFARSETEDLVLSFRKIDLSTQKDDAARLTIEDMRLQMVPISADKKARSANSALLPKMVFNVAYASTKDTRKLAFHAAGKALDLQLDSHFILPANIIERSIALAGKKFRTASANWRVTPTTTGAQRKNVFGNKRLASLTVDASFAGAVVHINGGEASPTQSTSNRSQQKGRYSQFVGDGSKSSMALRAPGVALRVEYQDDGHDPSLNAELRVDGSINTLLPTVVPIIIDISESIKAVVREKDGTTSPDSSNKSQPSAKPAAKVLEEENNIITADPTALLGRTRLNLGLRICRQEFSLSCQPIARVAAIAKLEDIYVTVNSVKSQEHGHFFAVSATFEKLQATVQHVYSRESTFGLDVESIVLSVMNSKHLSGTSGISAILKINPTKLQINARQLQDFLLFREIWIPPEIRQSSETLTVNVNSEPQEYLMQRYQQVTAATAFPWNANVAIADVKVDLDLGQAIGKSSLHVRNMWASSKKGTDWEQNLCLGVEKVGLESTGRTSGFVELAGIKVRTSIAWPLQETTTRQTPLIQASIGFRQLRVKTGFDYQAFAMADIANFEFVMHNVHEGGRSAQDRLVAILDGDKVHVFCHTSSAAQGLALWQAIERLVQENQQAYKQSLRDIEKFLRRKSSVSMPADRSPSQSMIVPKPDKEAFKAPISLHTDVVITLRSIKFGVFPSSFIDNQILALEAGDMQARFAVAPEKQKIHSSLGMTLGQLSVALSSVPAPKKNRPVVELTVEDVAESARSAKGGTILRVPKVIATMHTWQIPENNHIDYLFRSSLEGKVDVGWNYSRISYIRNMWSNHSRTLASRLGKPLPESNIKISTSQTSDPSLLSDATSSSSPSSSTPTSRPRAASVYGENGEKITAVVNVPQSKYEYTPLEPPLIETPQLRDMGEATPPLEWIGLHRDRLPNVTHQIVIVTLLEVAREVEDAYGRILGSS